MTLYLEGPDGIFQRFIGGPTQAIDGVAYSSDIERVWNPEELAEKGLYIPVDADPAPDGYYAESTEVVREDGQVRYKNVIKQYAPLTRIPKDFIWRRATNDEGEIMDQLLMAQPARIRRIYDGANYISTQDEFYTLLLGALTQAFGVDRALELLEPTE